MNFLEGLNQKMPMDQTPIPALALPDCLLIAGAASCASDPPRIGPRNAPEPVQTSVLVFEVHNTL